MKNHSTTNGTLRSMVPSLVVILTRFSVTKSKPPVPNASKRRLEPPGYSVLDASNGSKTNDVFTLKDLISETSYMSCMIVKFDQSCEGNISGSDSQT